MIADPQPWQAGGGASEPDDTAPSAPVVVIGAGPAGLTAALELARRGRPPLVLEAAALVGGISRTEEYRGFRFDIGGHRFYTKVAEVEALWRQVLGDELRRVSRRSRIYRNRRFFNYPLDFFNALGQTGPVESVRIGLSYLAARLRKRREAETFEEWVVARFGRRLYETFFRSYTEKVWGMRCHAIRADWAAQRIRSLSLTRAVTHAIFGNHASDSMVREFDYPARGPGMLWERVRELVEQGGGRVELGCPVVRLVHADRRVRAVVAGANGRLLEQPCEAVISSMPLDELVAALDPPAPPPVEQAARALRHRALIVVGLVVRGEGLFPDHWIYVHDPEVRVGRIQNYRNWSPEMCDGDGCSNLGLEYFCDAGDATWRLPDAELVALASAELAALGLAAEEDVVDAVVFRQSKAYPVYDEGYRDRVATIRSFLAGISNLQTVGRNGLHRYNNQDHSMVTALRAVDNLFGEQHDVWAINTEPSHVEEPELAGR